MMLRSRYLLALTHCSLSGCGQSYVATDSPDASTSSDAAAYPDTNCTIWARPTGAVQSHRACAAGGTSVCVSGICH